MPSTMTEAYPSVIFTVHGNLDLAKQSMDQK